MPSSGPLANDGVQDVGEEGPAVTHVLVQPHQPALLLLLEEKACDEAPEAQQLWLEQHAGKEDKHEADADDEVDEGEMDAGRQAGRVVGCHAEEAATRMQVSKECVEDVHKETLPLHHQLQAPPAV